MILIDTREKHPWDFSFYSVETKRVALPFGDYTVEGFEDKVVIERKASTGELAINLGKEISRFAAEFDRMRHVENKYVLCEFSSDDIAHFPLNSGIPKAKWKSIRMNSKFIFSRIESLSIDYGLCFIFAGDRRWAEEKAYQILTSL